MKAATHPNYVMHKEGQSLLAHALTINPILTRNMHKTIKSQLPRVRSSMLLAYGEIYLSAWKKASAQVLHTIEHDCLQDLANHCVHASSPSLASSIRKFSESCPHFLPVRTSSFSRVLAFTCPVSVSIHMLTPLCYSVDNTVSVSVNMPAHLCCSVSTDVPTSLTFFVHVAVFLLL